MFDKIAMFEQGVRNMKVDLNDSILKNINLQASVVRPKGRVRQLNEDMEWVLSSGIEKMVDKLFTYSSLYEPN